MPKIQSCTANRRPSDHTRKSTAESEGRNAIHSISDFFTIIRFDFQYYNMQKGAESVRERVRERERRKSRYLHFCIWSEMWFRYSCISQILTYIYSTYIL